MTRLHLPIVELPSDAEKKFYHFMLPSRGLMTLMICLTTVVQWWYMNRNITIPTYKFWNKFHRMTPTKYWQLQGQRYPIHVLLVSRVSCHPIALYDRPMTPKCTAVTNTTVSQIRSFYSTASRFPPTGHFETHAPNDPKMTLNTRSITSVPKSQMRLHFALWPTVQELQVTIWQVHSMMLKWHWTSQG